MDALKPTEPMTGLPLGGGKPRKHLSGGLLRFARREDGSLLILGMVLFLLMAMMGGLAVDLMRYEERRTQLQQTLDRSVLAAAALSQELEPEDVVNDYLAKAGLSRYLSGVTTDSGLNFRTVAATAHSQIQPFFMHMMGINTMTAAVGSGAEQRVSNVEISLVLDISGSMSGSRINNLRPAAREFVTTVLGTSDPGRVSVSIIPYNAQVNIGRPMMSSFNVTPIQDASSCIELPNSAFTSVELSTTDSFQHNSHFDPYNYTNQQNEMLRNCPPQAGNEVLPVSDSATELHDRINSLYADGNTSIDLGVKWGAYLLNPGAVSVVNDLIAANEVDAKFANRPLNVASADVLKVLVVMTDGQNTTEYKIRNPYNTGPSNIYRSNNTNRVSVFFQRPGNNDYWWPRTNSWNATRDGGNANSPQPLEWPEVWNDYSVTYVAYHFYGLALGQSYQSWQNSFMDYVGATKNQRLQSICEAAKQSGIVVYGIGFEAPASGRDQLRACATTTSHYFDAKGLEISTAFRAIANNISQLRLTQ